MVVALVSKPSVTLPLWEHFGFQRNEKGDPANLNEAICQICGVKRANTTNLRAHLASYHPAIEARLPLPPATQNRGAAVPADSLESASTAETVTDINA